VETEKNNVLVLAQNAILVMKTSIKSSAPVTGAVWRRLNVLKPLSPSQTQRIEALSDRLESYDPGAMLYSYGAGQIRPSFILAGWACRQRLLPDGRRQIFSLMLPGDAIGFSPEASPLTTASVVALTKVAIAHLEPPLGAATPPLTQADNASDVLGFADHMRLSAFLDEALLLDHVVRLGRQTAYERTAHLMLELHWRSTLIGQADDRSFTLPLTQEVLADVLGLSIVHVNRTLQHLRRDHLIEVTGPRVVLLDPAALTIIADFQPPVKIPQV